MHPAILAKLRAAATTAADRGGESWTYQGIPYTFTTRPADAYEESALGIEPTLHGRRSLSTFVLVAPRTQFAAGLTPSPAWEGEQITRASPAQVGYIRTVNVDDPLHYIVTVVVRHD